MSSVLEKLSKVTNLPESLFEETSSKTKNGLTQKVFFCEVEGDEYSVLINSKDEVFQIKNSYTTWNADIIKQLLTSFPTVQPQQNAPTSQSNASSTNVNTQTIPNNGVISGSFSSFHNEFKQLAVDFIKLNPGCISQLFGAPVNEAAAHTTSAFTIDYIQPNHVLGDYDVTLNLENCQDPSISGQVVVIITFNESTSTCTSISVEG